MSDKKSDVWDITTRPLTVFRVAFEEEITEDEARRRFMEEDFADILDENILDFGTMADMETDWLDDLNVNDEEDYED